MSDLLIDDDADMIKILTANYEARLHAMQTGVKMDLHTCTTSDNDDKVDSRVGINASKCDQAGLVRLLIEKGVFTLFEYHGHILNEMDREVARYEESLSEKLGKKITLG